MQPYLPLALVFPVWSSSHWLVYINRLWVNLQDFREAPEKLNLIFHNIGLQLQKTEQNQQLVDELDDDKAWQWSPGDDDVDDNDDIDDDLGERDVTNEKRFRQNEAFPKKIGPRPIPRPGELLGATETFSLSGENLHSAGNDDVDWGICCPRSEVSNLWSSEASDNDGCRVVLALKALVNKSVDYCRLRCQMKAFISNSERIKYN